MNDLSPAPHRRRRRPQQEISQEEIYVPTPAVRPLPGEKKKKKKGGKSSLTFAILVICYFSYFIFGSIDSITDIVRIVLTIVPVLLGIWLAVQGIQLHREHGAAKAGVFPGIGGAILALAVIELVTIFHPVSDLYYYGAGIASILCTGFTLIAVVRRYNLMATRPLPSFFDRKGGDVRG